MKKLYKNWTVHNLIAHPLSEIIWLITFGKGERFYNYIHDVTLPDNVENGRG